MHEGFVQLFLRGQLSTWEGEGESVSLSPQQFKHVFTVFQKGFSLNEVKGAFPFSSVASFYRKRSHRQSSPLCLFFFCARIGRPLECVPVPLLIPLAPRPWPRFLCLQIELEAILGLNQDLLPPLDENGQIIPNKLSKVRFTTLNTPAAYLFPKNCFYGSRGHRL